MMALASNALKHRLAFALELRVLLRGIPIIAGAGNQSAGGRGNLVERPCYWPGHVQRGAANAFEGLWRYQRQR